MTTRRRSKRLTTGSALFLLAFFAVLALYQYFDSAGPVQAPDSSQAGVSQTADWYSLYFTDPTSPSSKAYSGGPDQPLVDAIGAARMSVDVAAYELNLHDVRDALIAAHRRGVSVRMVMESDNIDESEVQDLKDAGIPILGDRREGLMHNKFMIIDRLEVWTGSMNYTVNGSYRNNNNLIRIRSAQLAEDYAAEFEEMFVDDKFGPTSPANTPYPTVTIGGSLVEVYFSPDDGTSARLVELIQGASRQVSFLAYSFTSDEIAAAMLGRADQGVQVSGVFETQQERSNVGTEYDHLRSAGLDVRLDGNPDNMHEKVIIIDGETVVTGSYNFSASAENRNDENTLVIHNPEIAASFLAEFQRVFAVAQP
jgi:phosphatidylserine/phosphatidylglycerophosphate/cardiolipin synthase-like enzyme